jgi:hypothetical protein
LLFFLARFVVVARLLSDLPRLDDVFERDVDERRGDRRSRGCQGVARRA